MNTKWVIARVINSTTKTSESSQQLVITVRFRLLEPLIFKGKRVRNVFSSFALTPAAAWRITQLLEAIEVAVGPDFTLPNKYIRGRYCRLSILPESYEGAEFLRVRAFATVNPPTAVPATDRANAALEELRIPARVSTNGELVIETRRDPDDAGDAADE